MKRAARPRGQRPVMHFLLLRTSAGYFVVPGELGEVVEPLEPVVPVEPPLPTVPELEPPTPVEPVLAPAAPVLDPEPMPVLLPVLLAPRSFRHCSLADWSVSCSHFALAAVSLVVLLVTPDDPDAPLE